MTFALSVLGIVASLGFAWWQHRRAVRAGEKLKQYLNDRPAKIADATRTILASVLAERFAHIVSKADVNDDGRPELLVQYPVGAHGSALKVFEWCGLDFQQLGELRVGTPVGFETGDFDGDGKLEVATEETDWSVGLPYYIAPRVRLLFRWNGREFTLVDRRKNYTEEDVSRLRQQLETGSSIA